MKVYRGVPVEVTEGGGKLVEVHEEDGSVRRLAHRTDPARTHSIDGFNWGYGGSGPSELAYCLLADAVHGDPEPHIYHPFKDDMIAPLATNEEWEITEQQVHEWIEGFIARKAAAES